MRVRYTARAIAEIDEICSFIAATNPTAAKNVAAAIARTIEWIARYPRTPPVVYGGEMRAKLVVPYQYRVFYVFDGSELTIRNVRHTRRQRPWEEGT